ncbi:hypothetical protein ASPBRDRAFT_74696 [Aspergillus brasiliensis CBS 101740]|uniref:Zn(2)-C6 fungal-type domain-containing protein n=1 Tax=Aspergillus brasiliensis (strain CBS 101740 / IMI 381727 / IBT 21946) TaxID=767769 RepID=A0A1L9UM93_ASPBC|nr:hypothetical protein ASPBRDRAFT_74696 [Aspergillus brasiliensis CBS 101740]
MATKRTVNQAGLGDEESPSMKRQSSEAQSFSPESYFRDLGIDMTGAQDLQADEAYLYNALDSTNQAQASAIDHVPPQENLDPTFLPIDLANRTADLVPDEPASTADNGPAPLVEQSSSASEDVSGGDDGDEISPAGGVSASQDSPAKGGSAESNNAPAEHSATTAAVSQEGNPAPPKKRKGRPPGSRNNTTRASRKQQKNEDSSEMTDDDKDDRKSSATMRGIYAKKLPPKPNTAGEVEETETSDEEEETNEGGKKKKKAKRGKKGKNGKKDPSRTSIACDNCKVRKAKCDKGLFGCKKCKTLNRTCWVTDPIWLRTERRGAHILMRRKIMHLEWYKKCLESTVRSKYSREKVLERQIQEAGLVPVPEEPLGIDPADPLMQQTIRYLKQSRHGGNTNDGYPIEFNTQGPNDLEDLISSPLGGHPEDHPERHPEYNTQGDADLEDYTDAGCNDTTPSKIRQVFERNAKALAPGPAETRQNEVMPGQVNNDNNRPAHPTSRRPSSHGTIPYPTTPPTAAYGIRYPQVNLGQQGGLQQEPTYNAQLNQLATGQFPPLPPTTPFMPHANPSFFPTPPGNQQLRPQLQEQQQQQRHAAQYRQPQGHLNNGSNSAERSNNVPAPPASESSTSSSHWHRAESASNLSSNNMFTQSARQVHPNAYTEELNRYHYQQQMTNTNLTATPQPPTGYSTYAPYEHDNLGQGEPQSAVNAYGELPEVPDSQLERMVPNELGSLLPP